MLKFEIVKQIRIAPLEEDFILEAVREKLQRELPEGAQVEELVWDKEGEAPRLFVDALMSAEQSVAKAAPQRRKRRSSKPAVEAAESTPEIEAPVTVDVVEEAPVTAPEPAAEVDKLPEAFGGLLKPKPAPEAVEVEEVEDTGVAAGDKIKSDLQEALAANKEALAAPVEQARPMTIEEVFNARSKETPPAWPVGNGIPASRLVDLSNL